MAEIDNCDGFNYWYRRLSRHPDCQIETVAATFRNAVAQDLSLRVPYPRIVWYAPEDHYTASLEWDAAYHQAPDLDWGPEQNPFLSPCEIFKFPKEEAHTVVHRGYTHCDGPRVVGILCNLSKPSTFGVIAHECVHVGQDDHRPGWRMANVLEADAEAEAYSETLEGKFPQFFSGPTNSQQE